MYGLMKKVITTSIEDLEESDMYDILSSNDLDKSVHKVTETTINSANASIPNKAITIRPLNQSG